MSLNNSSDVELESSSVSLSTKLPYLGRTETEYNVLEEEALQILTRIPNSHQDDVLARMLSGRNETFDDEMPPMGDDKPYPPHLPDRKPFRVEFAGPDDPFSPMNWPMRRKVVITAVLAYCTMCATFSSSIYGSALPQVEHVFHVGPSVASLGTFVFVFGFAVGPCVWGPLSEYLGRKIPLVVASFMMTCFSFGSATAQNFETLILCRFFAGASSSATLSVVPGALADVFDSHHRGKATSMFGLCVCGGPMMGPVVGSFIVHSFLGWRWCLYIPSIMSSLSIVLLVFFFPETYHAVVLVQKAIELRNRTQNWGIYANHETVALDIIDILMKSVIRPLKMLFMEPILFMISLYGGFVYGLLYMSLGAIPYMYETKYGWKTGVVGLPYVSILIGCVVDIFLAMVYFEPRYNRALDRTGLPVVPEERLVTMLVGAPVFSIGIFWMFWTGAYPITDEHPHGCHFMVPIVGGSLFGYGFIAIFLPMINYVIDSYLLMAASGMAANTFLRSAMGAAFPLFTLQMFENLGIQWAGTLVGCLSVLMLPIPFLLYKYGGAIRRKSRFAVDITQKSTTMAPKEKAQ